MTNELFVGSFAPVLALVVLRFRLSFFIGSIFNGQFPERPNGQSSRTPHPQGKRTENTTSQKNEGSKQLNAQERMCSFHSLFVFVFTFLFFHVFHFSFFYLIIFPFLLFFVVFSVVQGGWPFFVGKERVRIGALYKLQFWKTSGDPTFWSYGLPPFFPFRPLREFRVREFRGAASSLTPSVSVRFLFYHFFCMRLLRTALCDMR